MNTSSNPAKSGGVVTLAVGILIMVIAWTFSTYNIADNFLSFNLLQVFWIGAFFALLGLALWLLPSLTNSRNIALLMIAVGVIAIGVSAVYTVLNIADNFLTFNLIDIFWIGSFYVGVGSVLVFLARGGDAPRRPETVARFADTLASKPEPKQEKPTANFTPQAQAAEYAPPEYAPRPIPDDLTVIEGIGHQVQEALNQAGVFTFKQVADLNAQELYQIVKVEQGVRIIGDPATWSKQAQYLVDGDKAGLQAYQTKLIGGREEKKV
jgi:predicted flap endonuclease-1-like 5' DNA nuclease